MNRSHGPCPHGVYDLVDKAHIKQIQNIPIFMEQGAEVEDNQAFTTNKVVRESLSEDLSV